MGKCLDCLSGLGQNLSMSIMVRFLFRILMLFGAGFRLSRWLISRSLAQSIAQTIARPIARYV